MVAIPVYDHTGSKTREIEIDPKQVDKAVRKPLLKEALIAYLASQRQGTQHQVRGQVAGGSQKPWRKRAPVVPVPVPPAVQFGLVVVAPMALSHAITPIACPANNAAWPCVPACVTASKAVSSSPLKAWKSSLPSLPPSCRWFLEGCRARGSSVLFVSDNAESNLYLSARNIPKVEVVERRNLSAGPVLQRSMVFTAAALTPW